MIQPQTQTRDYWVSKFQITETDIENLYNFFLEVEVPQPIEQLVREVMRQRVAREKQDVERRMAGRTVYQPSRSYELNEQIIFPALKFATGTVTAMRKGYNPEHGAFNVIAVEFNGRQREFAADLSADHPLNRDAGSLLERMEEIDLDALYTQYGPPVSDSVAEALQAHPEFIRLGQLWFVKALLADINIGHTHLAEAVLEMNGGGPLPPDKILPHLDLSSNIPLEVQRFSLNYALLHDDRFDEVAPKGQVAWYLKRMEPVEVRQTPERLIYKPISYDRALLGPQLRLLERELDDEWSELEVLPVPEPIVLSLTYPHRWAGTLPLSARVRPLFPIGLSPRQSVTLVDEESGEEIDAWVVQSKRYVFGLKAWYEQNGIPVGGFVSLKSGPETGVILLNYDRRRSKREWVRLATVEDNRIKFDLQRRSIACGYDDLMIVGTDYVAAIDALWRRAETNQRSLVSLLAEVVPELAAMNPQNTVHAKTIYSAVNMLRRVPPGPIFAELGRHPAFRPMGDQYWQFDSSRWRDK